MYKIRNNRVRVLLVVALILSAITSFIVCPESVYAIDAPDDIDIRSVQVFRNLLTDDIANYDQLYVVHYELKYAAFPTDYTVKESFIFELRNTDGSLLGTQLAYAYANTGYGQGVVAFYFDVASAPTWGLGYTVKVVGNPVVFAVVPSYSYTLTATNYNSSTDANTNKEALKDYVLGVSEFLESEWLITLTSEQDAGTVLSSGGEKYFRTTIKGIQTMCPALFFLQYATINTTERTWGTSLSDFYKGRLDGVDGIPGTADDSWIRTAIQRPLDELNVSYTMGIGLIVLIICVVLLWQSKKHFNTAMPGYVGSIIVIEGATVLTLGFTLISIVVLFLSLAGGWVLFMRKA